MIHYAKIENSPRLQRTLAVLQSGKPATTLEIMMYARVCAVNSIISELRRNGFEIDSRPVKGGGGIWEYQLVAV